MAPKDNKVTTLIFRGHVTSSVTWPFDSEWSTSYGWSIVTMRLFGTVIEIWRFKVHVHTVHTHTDGTTDRTSNLLISSNVHYVYLGGDNYAYFFLSQICSRLSENWNFLLQYFLLTTQVMKDRSMVWFLRRMLKISWTEKTSNEEVFKKARVHRTLMKKIHQRQPAFLGHELRKHAWSGELGGDEKDR